MNVYLVLGLNFLPFILFISALLVAKFRFPKLVLPLLFVLVSLLPITVIQYFLASFFSDSNVQKYGLVFLLFGAFLDFGLVEEGFKTLAFVCVPSKKYSLLEFCLASMLAGLFLGCCESAIYFLNGLKGMLPNTPSRSVEILPVVFLRMGTSDLIHMLCAGICSIFVWNVRHGKKNVLPLLIGIFIHGIYDYFILIQSNEFFAIITILFAAIQCRSWYEMSKNENGINDYVDATAKEVEVTSKD